MNTTIVMTLNDLELESREMAEPRRFAGTARQYSNSAIDHETRIAFQRGQS